MLDKKFYGKNKIKKYKVSSYKPIKILFYLLDAWVDID